MIIFVVVLQRKNKSAIYNKFSTWQIEECVQDVKAIGVVSLNEFVGVVVVNVFSVKHKHKSVLQLHAHKWQWVNLNLKSCDCEHRN